jgi:hypothetical protein
MGVRTAITINDSVPAAHTFNPSQDNLKGVAFFYDRAVGIAAGYGVITIKLVEPPSLLSQPLSGIGNRMYKAEVRVMVPTLETVSNNSAGYVPAPRPAYVCQSKTEFWLPERASLLDRKNLLAYTKNVMANAAITNLVENLEGVY